MFLWKASRASPRSVSTKDGILTVGGPRGAQSDEEKRVRPTGGSSASSPSKSSASDPILAAFGNLRLTAEPSSKRNVPSRGRKEAAAEGRSVTKEVVPKAVTLKESHATQLASIDLLPTPAIAGSFAGISTPELPTQPLEKESAEAESFSDDDGAAAQRSPPSVHGSDAPWWTNETRVYYPQRFKKRSRLRRALGSSPGKRRALDRGLTGPYSLDQAERRFQSQLGTRNDTALVPTEQSQRLGASTRRQAARSEHHANLIEDRLAALQLQNEQAQLEERLEKERKAAEERRRLEEAELARRGWREKPARPVIGLLSSDWKAKLAGAMASAYTRQIATAPDGAPLLRKDFGTLYPQPKSPDAPSGWLNDEIINSYMQHIVDYAHSRVGHKRGETPRFHAWRSQFYQNLSTKGYESIARWVKRAKMGGEKLKDVEMVFIPCNPGVHWTMIIVQPKRKLVEYFDSFHGHPDEFLDLAEEWLRNELPDFDLDKWTFRAGIGPSQRNSQDCGVFAVTTAKMVMLGIDPEKAYTEKDLLLQRRRMACELINGGFTGDFAPHEEDIFTEILKAGSSANGESLTSLKL